ncbi:hypothetical protein SLEP1_g53792 [Rubroshorea leprosula]|uniref:Uncharacterized protein n=1 Tax=Rubroshorea leprosula TaxID=152421 RepID=A0AAV5MBJ1_9ROSI|nr:hypothetical protein SLEP1_g53792 [Rubroshorea leprosula]
MSLDTHKIRRFVPLVQQIFMVTLPPGYNSPTSLLYLYKYCTLVKKALPHHLFLA